MGLFMLMLDSTVVTLALPDVQRELDASSSELQWVLNAYLLALAVLVVTAGRLGDVYGRRRLFLLGVLVFTVGLVIAATASGMEVLIGARVIQGVGGAAMLTLSLAIVSEAFDESRRSRALGIWAGVSALALSLGPILGGLLVDSLSWRWVFWIGVPPLVAGYLITSRAARETRDEQADPHVDVPGLTALTVGLTASCSRSCRARSGVGTRRRRSRVVVGVAGWWRSRWSSRACARRSSTSRCSATARTSARAPPPSASSGLVGRDLLLPPVPAGGARLLGRRAARSCCRSPRRW